MSGIGGMGFWVSLAMVCAGAGPAGVKPAASAVGALPAGQVAQADALIARAMAELKLAQRAPAASREEQARVLAPLSRVRLKRGDNKGMLELVEATRGGSSERWTRQLEAEAYAVLGERAKFDKAMADLSDIGKRGSGNDALAAMQARPALYARAGDFERAVKAAGELAPFSQVRAYSEVAIVAWHFGKEEEYRKQIAAAEAAMGAAPEQKGFSGRDQRERLFVTPLAARLYCGDLAGAREMLGKVKQAWNRAAMAQMVAEAGLKAGDKAAYTAAVTEALAAVDGMEGKDTAFSQLLGLARVQSSGGDAAGAEQTLAKAAGLLPQVAQSDESQYVTDLARAYAAAGDVARAREVIGRSAAAVRRMGDDREQRDPSWRRLAVCYAAVNDLPAARAALKQIKVRPNFNDERGQAETDRQIVVALIAAKNYKGAEQYLVGLTRPELWGARLEVARAAVGAGDFATATRLVKELSVSAKSMAGAAAREIGVAYAKAGRPAATEVAALVKELPPVMRAEVYAGVAEALLEGQPLPPAARGVPMLPLQ
jgi:hypothetical protein